MIRFARWFLPLSLMLTSPIFGAEETVNEEALFAYPTPEGVVWVNFFEGIMLSRTGEGSRTLWQGGVGFAAVSGSRLVLSSGTFLSVFSAGSWTPQETPAEKWIVAVAGSPETALAFDEAAALWRLGKEGGWQQQVSGIKDQVIGLAYSRGLWVAVGSTRDDEADEANESMLPAEFTRPYWEVAKIKPRLWWSADGSTWQPGVLPDDKSNKLMAVAGSPNGWLAAGVDGSMFGSKDGKTWTRIDSFDEFKEEQNVVLQALGGSFWVRYGSRSWARSADGKMWEWVKLAAGARLDFPFMKDGQVQAVGVRKEGRRLEVAPVVAFGVEPPLNAAELAAKAAVDEKARIAAAEKAAAAKKAADAKALAAKQAADANAMAERKAAEAKTNVAKIWAAKLAAWDVAMTQAKDTATRLKLTRALHVDWKAAHPGYTQAQVLAYLAPFFDRVTGYETSDASVYGFVVDAIGFSQAISDAFVQSMPAGTAALVKGLAQDRLAVIRAEQQRLKAPVLPARIKTKNNPPGPVSTFAVLDLSAVRMLAASGDAAAAYDLGTAYSRGQGVPTDAIASRFWVRLAKDAGLDIPAAAKDDQAAQAAVWRRLGEQGSRMGHYYFGYMLREGQGGSADAEAAHGEFKRAAAVGHRDAMVALAKQYRTGQGTALDLDAARKILDEAVALGFPPAMAELGWVYEVGAGVPRDLTKAAGLYRRAAEFGYAWAMNRYANFLFSGHGMPKDAVAARTWMQKAAANGDANSKAALAALVAGNYEPPALVSYAPPTELRAVFDVATRRQQAEAGDAAACYDLAYAYLQGIGVRQDHAEETRWLGRSKAAGWNVMEKWDTPAEKRETWRRVADQGSIVGLGRVVLVTYGNSPEAVATVRLAAEAGSTIGQWHLAARYRDGVGVTADQAEAVVWMRRASEIGDSEAQAMLGYAYEVGQGVTRDQVEATRWYRRSAEGGNRVGMANLANQLNRGLGVVADPQEAARWYLQLAGLPAEAMSPIEAAKKIQAKAEQNNPAAYAVWGIMLRRGFGVILDNEAGFAYGFAASKIGEPIYQLSWFESTGLRRAPALRQAASLMVKAFEYLQVERSGDATYAEKIKNGEIPTRESIYKLARPENAIAARVLRAIEDGTLDVALARVAGQSHEPFKVNGFTSLVDTTVARADLVGQPWLLRLAGVSEKAADAPAVEKLFQAALLSPAEDDAASNRLQTLRRLAAARLYYGIGREADRPAAFAWALVSVTDADSLFAVDLLTRELTADQIASAEELYQRITARLAPVAK